jgi:pilus assembly protein CpaF
LTRDKPLIFAVTGAKGGVGCTHLATQLAQSFALAGKSTVICDLNWRTGGDVHLFLGTPIETSVYDWLQTKQTGRRSSISAYLQLHESGLQVLATPSFGMKIGYGQDVCELASALTPLAEVVVFDCGTALDEVTMSAMDAADVVLLATTGDVVALENLLNRIERLRELQYVQDRFRLVLNERSRLEISFSEMKALLGGEFYGIIPEGLSEAFMAIREIAERLWSEHVDGVLFPQIEKKKSFFSRLVPKLRIRSPQKQEEPPIEESVDAIGLRKIKIEVHQQLMDRIDIRKIDLAPDTGENLRKQVEQHVTDILSGYRQLKNNRPLRLTLVKEIVNEVLGLGHLEEFLQDPEVTEIMVNGAEQVYVERRGRIELTDRTFINDAQVLQILERILAPLGRRIDESSPMVDARLPDGSRVNAVIPPLAVDCPTLTIRKFEVVPFTMKDLVLKGTIDRQTADIVSEAVRAKRNIIISGGTGSGKTTLLNVLSDFIGRDERIITIEDAAELRLKQAHVIRLEARPANIEGKGEVAIRDLVRNALRMRPDRIIVGEVRGGEALDMLQAMNTGHKGSLSTIHANSPRDAISRLETMVLMADVDLPLGAIRNQIASAIDLIIHMSRQSDGSRRVISMAQIKGIREGEIVLGDLLRTPAKASEEYEGPHSQAVSAVGDIGG